MVPPKSAAVASGRPSCGTIVLLALAVAVAIAARWVALEVNGAKFSASGLQSCADLGKAGHHHRELKSRECQLKSREWTEGSNGRTFQMRYALSTFQLPWDGAVTPEQPGSACRRSTSSLLPLPSKQLRLYLGAEPAANVLCADCHRLPGVGSTNCGLLPPGG